MTLVECFVCTITYAWSNTNWDCETKANEKNTKIFSLMLRFFFFVLFCLFVFFLNDRWRWSLYFISCRLSQHTISCCVIKEIIIKKSDPIGFSYNIDLWCRWRYARSLHWVYTSRKVNLRRFFLLLFFVFPSEQYFRLTISITFL